jgi:glycosyltransferase involved in cell wall biosynthesis
LGVPSVAFATGGLTEVVESEVSGLLVPPGDTPAFALAVGRLAADAPLRRRLADGGQVRAAQFSVERMMLGTAAVYDQVLATRRASAGTSP